MIDTRWHWGQCDGCPNGPSLIRDGLCEWHWGEVEREQEHPDAWQMHMDPVPSDVIGNL